jgi:D-alanine-D-alanine ligase
MVGKLRVAVLMGGTSTERAISLSTGNQIVAALDPEKYQVIPLDSAALLGSAVPELPHEARALPAPSASALEEIRLADIAVNAGAARPEVVILALHGKGGEDGTIQGMLELLGIPYTGSGVLASALAMDKAMAKQVLRAEGIPVPRDLVLRENRRPEVESVHQSISDSFGYPVIVKPNAGGSTIGCTIVRNEAELERALDEGFRYDPVVLVEEFIKGTEITAGLLGNEDAQVLPLIEIVAESGFYDYEAKYAPGGSRHIIPARIPERASQRAREYALRSFQALQCSGCARVDMIVRGDDPYVLEVNTIPGMTPTSLLPEAARASGIEFPELLNRLVQYALDRGAMRP